MQETPNAVQCGVDVARDHKDHAGRKLMLYIESPAPLSLVHLYNIHNIYECPLGPHEEDCRHDPARFLRQMS